MIEEHVAAFFILHNVELPDLVISGIDLDPGWRKLEDLPNPLAGYSGGGAYAWLRAEQINQPVTAFLVGQVNDLVGEVEQLWNEGSNIWFNSYLDAATNVGELLAPLVALWFGAAPDEWSLISKFEPELNIINPTVRQLKGLDDTEIRLINDLGREDRALPGMLLLTRYRMENDFYNPLFVDAVVQHDRDHYTLFEALTFLEFWSAIGMGAIVIASLDCDGEPSGDSDTDFSQINAMLDGHPLFKVTGDPLDPSLVWTEPIEVGQKSGATGEQYQVELPPYYAPLSIGYIEHEMARILIGDNMVLARWPMDSDSILLIHRANPDLWNPKNSNKQGDILDGWTPPIVGE